MSRSPSRPAAVFAAVVVLTPLALLAPARPAAAEPPSPVDLVRGLRENGHTDLAIEYLDELAAGNAAADVRAVIPLERALAHLAAADDETDDAARDALTGRAKTELEAFLGAQSRHPRGPEAAVALARITALGAKGILTRAAKLKDDAEFKAAAAQARKPFADAAKAFGSAAAQLDAQLKDPALAPARKAQVAKELAQAELDRAITQYQISRTYVVPTAAEIGDRGAAVKVAKKEFDAIADAHKGSPVRFVALAWSGQCDLATDAPLDAEKRFAEVRRDQSPQSYAGKRLVRYFEARVKFENALTKNTVADNTAARAAAAGWLRDFGTGRPTPETHAVRYQLAFLKQREAFAQVKEDPKTKQLVVPGPALALLREANRDYRRVTESDNEYTDRAAAKRKEVMRVIVGDAETPPAKLATFEEAEMAGAVQFDKALGENGDARTARLAKVVALFERAVSLPVPRDAAGGLTDARLRLAFAYLMADRPYQSAVLGEHIARSVRTPAQAAKGGLYAVHAYLAAANKAPVDDSAAKIADQERAVAVCRHLDKTFPADPSTDDARVVVGQLLAHDGKSKEAFDLLGRVGRTHPRAAAARLAESQAAFDLMRAAGKAGSTAEKADVYRRLVADIQAVPKPEPGATPAAAESYARLALVLAQTHLFDAPAGLPKAEAAAAAVPALLKELTQVGEPERQAIGFQAEETRLRAIYGQVAPLFRAGKSAEVMARLDPLVADVVKAGPAVKGEQPPAVAAAAKRLDDFRRNDIILLALKTRIREKAVDKAGQLFDLLKTLGGSVDASVQALAQLVAGVRPDIDALRKEGKADEAATLVDGVGKLLDKVITEPALTPGQKMYLGRALKDMGSYDKAAEVLKAVPAPPPADLAQSPTALPQGDARTAVLLYRGAQLDLAETYRLAKKYPEADAVLKPAMDPATGWAKTAPNFRKEALYLIEAKAADTAAAPAATKLWSEAIAGWNKMAAEYRAFLVRPLPADPAKQADEKRQREMVVKPLYFEAFYEVQRCFADAQSQLLKGNPAKLGEAFDKIADTIKRVDESNPDLKDEVRAKFTDLLYKHPDLLKRYEAKGGKGLLKPAAEPAPAAAAGTP